VAKYTSEHLRGRRVLDYRVAIAMGERCEVISVEAYTTATDLRARRNPITGPDGGPRALHYLVTYRIKTLVGPGQFANETRIHVDTEITNYPFKEPASWVLSQTPWSPHFKTGAVVCTGDHWKPSGESLLGHLIRHHAKLLNWDEVARGGGYVGWNGAAIAWHKKHYGDKPLTAELDYPEIPADIAYGVEETTDGEAEGLFGQTARHGTLVADGIPPDHDLFAGSGRRSR
jgi:hypothetical protein